MYLIGAFLLTAFLSALLIPFFNSKGKGLLAVSAVLMESILSSILAFHALGGAPLEFLLPGSYAVPDIAIRIDALSGWFILVINFTVCTGAIYGSQYMKAYGGQPSNLTLH